MFSMHQRTRRAVDRLLTRGLSRRRHLALRDHLRECDDCRAYYGRVRRLEDALFDVEGLNPAAQARVASLFVADPPTTPGAASKILGAFAAAAAVALLALVGWPQRGDELAARGAVDRAGELSVFRVDTRAHQIERLTDGGKVRAGDVIQLAYMSRGYDHAVVIGVDAGGEVQWYYPANEVLARQGGVPVRTDGVEEPFGGSWTITATEGRLRFYAVFADGPVAAQALQTAVAGLITNKRMPDRLPEVPAHQYTLDLEVTR